MEELVEYVKKGKDDEGNEVNMLELWDSKSLPQYYANAAEYWEVRFLFLTLLQHINYFH